MTTRLQRRIKPIGNYQHGGRVKRKKGDRRRENIGGSGEATYESMGSEPQPGYGHQRPDDDPERIDLQDWNAINRADEEWRNTPSDNRGPYPSFKDKPNFDNAYPDKPGGEPRQRYEHWRRVEIPTMQKGGRVKKYQKAGAVETDYPKSERLYAGTYEEEKKRTSSNEPYGPQERQHQSQRDWPKDVFGYHYPPKNVAGYPSQENTVLYDPEGRPYNRAETMWVNRDWALRGSGPSPSQVPGYSSAGHSNLFPPRHLDQHVNDATRRSFNFTTPVQAQDFGRNPELDEYERWINDMEGANRLPLTPRTPPRPDMAPNFDEGGRVQRDPIGYPQPEPREPLEVPIGRGTLTLNPEYTPEQTMGGSVRYEHPVGNRGWSVGAHGNVDRYIGPGYEDVPVRGGGGFFVRKKFQQGGAVPDRKFHGRSYEHEPNAKSGIDTTMPKGAWSSLYEGPHSEEPDDPPPYVHTYDPDPAGGSPTFRRWKQKQVPTMQQGGRVQMAEAGDRRKHPGTDEELESTGKEYHPGWRLATPYQEKGKVEQPFKPEYWVPIRKEVPTSAVDTGVVRARGGGRIKKFQGAGMVDAEGRPIDVPVEPPQQPAPGAAGQTAPVVPPTGVTGPVTPTPTKAIGTSGFVDPLADFKDDADLEAEKRQHDEMMQGGKMQSIRPGGEFLSGAPPTGRAPDTHAEWSKLEHLKSLLPEIQKQNPKQFGEAARHVQQMENRLIRETNNINKQQHSDYMKQETSEIRKADNARRAGLLQLPQLDRDAQDGFIAEQTSLQKIAANAKTPEQRRNAAMILRASPMSTIGDKEGGPEGDRQRAYLVRELLNTNHDMNARDAAAAVMHLATPPMRGTKGFNGLTGRGAASYAVGPRDPVGNYMLQTEIGTIRVSPKVYGLIKQARGVGYNNMLDEHKAYVDAKKKEAEPGFVTRNIDPIIEGVSTGIGNLFK